MEENENNKLKEEITAENSKNTLLRQRALAANIEAAKEIEAPARKYFNYPTSPASNLIIETLTAGEDIEEIPDRKRKINNSTVYTVYSDDNNDKNKRLTLENKKVTLDLRIENIEELTGSNKTAKKFFLLSLIKANEQAIHNGQATSEYISYPLQDLIDIGLYSTLKSARRGFLDGMKRLSEFSLYGQIQISERKKIDFVGLRPFGISYIENNQCYTKINSEFGWGGLFQFFSILPFYYFKLPNKASDLLEYIFYLARQNARKIEEQGYFTISFRAIQEKLFLPSEIKNHNPLRNIKKPILDAIEQIEAEHKASYDNKDLVLIPKYDDKATIEKFLEDGYLQVEIKGDFADIFIEQSRIKAKQIEQVQKRKLQRGKQKNKEEE